MTSLTDLNGPAAMTAATTPAARTAQRVCPLCEAACGLTLQVRAQNGVERVVSIRGDNDDVFSHGYICPKAIALMDLHDDPDRLRTPLIKRGGVHVPATWDEAFAEIDPRLQAVITTHGRNAVGVVAGNPNVHKLGLALYGPRFMKALGTRNVFSASSVDQVPRQLACGWLYGHWLSVPVPDIDHTDFLLMLGANPLASNGSMWTVPDFRGRLKALQARGGTLTVVDPRRTETAAAADTWLPIRPGGDVFLLAALAHALFAQDRVRLGRAAPWVSGLETVREALLPFTPDAAAAHCGITADTIRALAHQLSNAPRAAVYGRIGTNTQSYGTLCAWLIDVLNVITGRLDEVGGLMFPKAAAFAANTEGPSGSGRGVSTGRHHSRVSAAPEVMSEFPLTLLAEEIDTPGENQIRALFTIASNPVLSAPGSGRLDRALAGLDLMVSLDIYLNETTRHADVILPGLSPFEEAHYDVAFSQLSTRNQARYSPPVLAANPEQLPEWEILLRLAAIAQGLGPTVDTNALDHAQFERDVLRRNKDHAPTVLAALAGIRGPERLLDLSLRTGPYGDQFGAVPGGLSLASLKSCPHGIDHGALAPRLPEVLRTPSGHIELAPPALIADLARPLAALQGPTASPDPDELLLIGRRDVRSNNSWMHNLPTLAKGPFRGVLLVHPQDADRLGLVNGGMARLERLASTEGSRPEPAVTVQLATDENLMPGVVCMPHGWGHDTVGARLRVAAERPGANMNAVLDAALRDPVSGNAVLSGVAVRLMRA